MVFTLYIGIFVAKHASFRYNHKVEHLATHIIYRLLTILAFILNDLSFQVAGSLIRLSIVDLFKLCIFFLILVIEVYFFGNLKLATDYKVNLIGSLTLAINYLMSIYSPLVKHFYHSFQCVSSEKVEKFH